MNYDNVVAIMQSDKAVWCEFRDMDTRPRAWIPKSVIDEESEVKETGDKGTLVVKDWFVEKTLADELVETIKSRSEYMGRRSEKVKPPPKRQEPKKLSPKRKGRFSKGLS